MKYKLFSIPTVDLQALNLDLPLPDGINNGGFLLPQGHAYSSIDLLIYCLSEPGTKNIREFFIKNPMRKIEEHIHVGVINTIDSLYFHHSVYGLKCLIHRHKDTELYRILKLNAPLTFMGDVK